MADKRKCCGMKTVFPLSVSTYLGYDAQTSCNDSSELVVDMCSIKYNFRKLL
jgi:hypothetical protein